MAELSNDGTGGLAAFAPNPFGTGRIFPAAASRTLCVASTTRQRPLLTAEKIRSRHSGAPSANRS